MNISQKYEWVRTHRATKCAPAPTPAHSGFYKHLKSIKDHYYTTGLGDRWKNMVEGAYKDRGINTNEYEELIK
jgi:hypothetical protein